MSKVRLTLDIERGQKFLVTTASTCGSMSVGDVFSVCVAGWLSNYTKEESLTLNQAIQALKGCEFVKHVSYGSRPEREVMRNSNKGKA